ncbi:hypothetical protein PTKIN_Ptkin05aG0011100 [Pterospermum kingtungense]
MSFGHRVAIDSQGDPKTWVPLMNNKDCSKGSCSLYCPQFCYSNIIFPPPPPPIEFDYDVSGPKFSPLVIAIMGILASALLLVTYYTIISRYCGNMESTRGQENEDTAEVLEENLNPLAHEPWHEAWQTSTTTGLDEALIKSIAVRKYRKGDGKVEGTECSVCLSEFQEDESLRLLPKCSHAFHVSCIDTWLRSHSNCPLCRANIVFVSASPLPLPPPPLTVTETPSAPGIEADLQNRQPPWRALSDLGNVQRRDTVIEIREEDYQQMRRSISMDHHFCRNPVSMSDILHMSHEEDNNIAGPSKQAGEASKISSKKRVLHCVMNPAAIKRSFSSGRLFLTRQGRVRDASIPL